MRVPPLSPINLQLWIFAKPSIDQNFKFLNIFIVSLDPKFNIEYSLPKNNSPKWTAIELIHSNWKQP